MKKAMTNYKEKPRPYKLLETGVRVIDTMNPIVEGGTGFIEPDCRRGYRIYSGTVWYR